MAVYKCKMCGGTIEFEKGDAVGTCDSCGTKQTLPKTNDDVISNLFNRANNLRLKCEFDKAMQIYEKIVEQDDSEAEAHWGIVLCKYGIEYVEDPKTFKRIPTCHRTLFDAVTTDADYLAAIDYSDAIQQSIYESEARAIDRIQKEILAIVKNEKAFDVFICYKETDENGERTIDSAIANDIYYQLTQEGFKVFFAAITLEDKLGREYEPYIFAALNSAKVMLVLGTKPEYYSAVWVKNEWSRFLHLMKTDRSKLLIPCYRDMDAYDLPEEFAHLQAQDMSKIGFINDVVRGIKKVINKSEPEKVAVVDTVTSEQGPNVDPLLKRVFMFLEDGEWDSADEYCEKVLDINPECAKAYLGKLMAELRLRKCEDLKKQSDSIENRNNYQKALRFADEELKAELEECADNIRKIKEAEKRKEENKRILIANEKAKIIESIKAEREKLEELRIKRYDKKTIWLVIMGIGGIFALFGAFSTMFAIIGFIAFLIGFVGVISIAGNTEIEQIEGKIRKMEADLEMLNDHSSMTYRNEIYDVPQEGKAGCSTNLVIVVSILLGIFSTSLETPTLFIICVITLIVTMIVKFTKWIKK